MHRAIDIRDEIAKLWETKLVRRLVELLLLFAVVFWPLEASAQTGDGLELNYEAPQGCPTRDSFLEEVRALAKDQAARGKRVHVVAKIAARFDKTYQLTLILPTGTRILDGDSCADVAEAGALVIALLLADPDFQPAEEPKPPPASAGPPVIPAQEPRCPRPFFVEAALGVDTGTLMRAALLSELRMGAGCRVFSVGVTARLSERVKDDVDAGRSLTAQLFGGQADLCAHALRSRFLEARVCWRLSASALLVRGDGIEEPSRAAPVLVQSAFTAGLLGFPGARLHPVIDVGGALPLRRPTIILDGPGPAIEGHRPGPAFQAWGGLRVRF